MEPNIPASSTSEFQLFYERYSKIRLGWELKTLEIARNRGKGTQIAVPLNLIICGLKRILVENFCSTCL
jgi:hypothetical protein